MDATQPSAHRGPSRLTTRMASGLFALIPIVVTVAILRFVFNASAGVLLPVVDSAVGAWPPFARMALAVGILLVGVYLLGEVAAHVVGRRVLSLVERIVLRVPLVKVVYSVSKQVVGAFQDRGSRPFKAVVYVDFPHPGLKAVGFVTSSFTKADGSDWSTVFVPTTPNPTTGFLQLVRTGKIERTAMTVEEGIKMVMSLGVLQPVAPHDAVASPEPAAPHDTVASPESVASTEIMASPEPDSPSHGRG